MVTRVITIFMGPETPELRTEPPSYKNCPMFLSKKPPKQNAALTVVFVQNIHRNLAQPLRQLMTFNDVQKPNATRQPRSDADTGIFIRWTQISLVQILNVEENKTTCEESLD